MNIIDRRRIAIGGQANNRTLAQITHIAWHYTATTNSNISNHERHWRNTLGWSRGGYHFYIDRAGNIYQNYNYRTRTNGVGNNNTYVVHICAEASTANNYTDAQVKSRDWITRKVMGDLSIPASNVLGHKEFPGQSTSCPGYSVAQMNSFRKQLAGGKATTPSTSKPSTGSGLTSGARLVKNENGYFLLTENIKVRTAPTTTAKHVKTLKKGDSVKYTKVYEGNGFRWLLFNGNTYLPYRESGAGKQSWGTFHATRPSGSKAPAQPKNNNVTGYTGGSLVNYLNLSGNKHLGGSSFNNRKKLANANGISNYRGTAAQNTNLLNKLQAGGGGGTASTPKPANKNVTGYTGGSLVNYLNLSGNKHLGGSSFDNRKKLASANGISNYKGTAAQNTTLLNKLQGGGRAVAPAKKRNVQNYRGTSLVDYLNLSGNKHLGGSSFNNRKKLASANGISNYKGTATQNTRLLNALKKQ